MSPDQTSLFTPTTANPVGTPKTDREYARARNTDPPTSHQAAQSVRNIGEAQECVLAVLRGHGACNDTEMIRRYRTWPGLPQLSDAGLRTRRAELVTKGLVRDSGKRVKLPSGRSSIVWEAV